MQLETVTPRADLRRKKMSTNSGPQTMNNPLEAVNIGIYFGFRGLTEK